MVWKLPTFIKSSAFDSPGMRPLSILAIDDDPLIGMLTAAFVRRFGYALATAEPGRYHGGGRDPQWVSHLNISVEVHGGGNRVTALLCSGPVPATKAVAHLL